MDPRCRFLQPLRDLGRNLRLGRVEAEQFIRGGKFLGRSLQLLLGCLFLLRGKFGVLFHIAVSSGGFFKMGGKGFAGAMQLAAHGVGGLTDHFGNLLVTQFFIRYQQQQAVFLG